MKTRIASAFLNVSVCLARRQSSLLRSLMECRSSLLWSFYDFHAEGFAWSLMETSLFLSFRLPLTAAGLSRTLMETSPATVEYQCLRLHWAMHALYASVKMSHGILLPASSLPFSWINGIFENKYTGYARSRPVRPAPIYMACNSLGTIL